MKKALVLFAVSVLLMACSLPFTLNWNTPEPTTEPITIIPEVIVTAEPAVTVAPATIEPLVGIELNLGGVYMVLPPCLAAGAVGALEPALPPDPQGGPMSVYPAHRLITFQGYPLAGKFFEPEVRVYPLADYTAMLDNVDDTVANLQALITSQTADPATSIPFLPGFPAAQLFRAQVKFVNFANGQGVRFLTEYGQYSAPVNNNDLFYTYQGVTTDGAYWVSIIFPVNAAYLQSSLEDPTLPPSDVSMPDYTAAQAGDIQAYYTEMNALLNSTADNQFTPGLDCLDQFVQTISIGN
jgi:hypothetical protein